MPSSTLSGWVRWLCLVGLVGIVSTTLIGSPGLGFLLLLVFEIIATQRRPEARHVDVGQGRRRGARTAQGQTVPRQAAPDLLARVSG